VHQEDGSLPTRAEPTESSTARQVFKLLFCAAGLQVGALGLCVWPSHSGTRRWVGVCAISSLKTKDAVLSWIGAGLEAGTQPLNQDSPPELLCHL